MYVVWHHDDLGPEPQASCRDRSKHPDRHLASRILAVDDETTDRLGGTGEFLKLVRILKVARNVRVAEHERWHHRFTNLRLLVNSAAT